MLGVQILDPCKKKQGFCGQSWNTWTDGNEVYFFRMILNKAYFIPTLGVRGTSKLRTGVKSKCHHLKDRNHFQIFLRIFNGNFHSRFFFHFPTLRKPTFGQTTMPYRASALPFCLHHCFVQTLKQDWKYISSFFAYTSALPFPLQILYNSKNIRKTRFFIPSVANS